MAKKARNKFKFRQGKNLFVQLVVMLPLSLVQTVAGIMAVAGLMMFLFGTNGQDPLQFSNLFMAVLFGAIAVGISVVMVKLKGTEATETEWNSTFRYDWESVPVGTLQDVNTILARTFKVDSVNPFAGETERAIGYLSNINSCDWNECPEADLSRILSLLNPYKISGGEEVKLTTPTVIWALLSPVAFLLQWIAVVFAIMQCWSRRIYSRYGEIPFPIRCLKWYKLQEVLHFLFNFVYIDYFYFQSWMGNCDERPVDEEGGEDDE